MRYIIGLICFSSIFLFSIAYPHDIPEYVGIFYSKPPPDEVLYLYDWIIVDPHVFSMKAIKERFWMKKRAKLIAYLSIGEMGRHNKYYNQIRKEWILGQNRIWKSVALDLRKKRYRDLLIDNIVPSIIKRGYEGVMLDTLDSYQRYLNKKEWKGYERAEIEFIKELRERYPYIIIIVNRPFRIIDQIKALVDAFLAESLFYGLDSNLNYIKMKQGYTNLLLKRLRHIKSLGLPVIVVDYINPQKRELAKKVAKRIKKLGFIPYVTDKNLSVVGIGACEIIPRKVLLLYDSRSECDPALSSIHRLIQMPLEWLGLVPVVYDINKGFPKGYLGDTYTGIVVWVPELKNPVPFYKWIKKKMKEGVKVFFVGSFGFPIRKELLKSLRIKVVPNKSKPLEKPDIIKEAGMVGFEIQPLIEYTDYLLYPGYGTALIIAENSKGQIFAPIAITSWGGYSIPDTCMINSMAKEDLWVVDPFRLFKLIFKPSFPVPDVTTENGRRLLTAHIDGDSFFGNSEFDPSKTTGEIIRDNIIKVYKIPHTVSVIEGEVAPWGLYPNKSRRLEKIAKTIFALPNVEAASHTFSHPFFWKKSRAKQVTEKEYGNHLPIKGYKFNVKREIVGSVRYINERLVPKGKKVRVFLWSGDCLPSEEALQLTYDLGIYNVNGGDTTITNQAPFLSHISPMGINLGRYFQVYAPVQNENLYTNLWHGPYYGYINVISTFKLTDKPRRIKPNSIYYHF